MTTSGPIPPSPSSPPPSMLSAIGTARRIDALGRVVVPAEIRRLLGLEEGDLLDIHVVDGRIVMGRIELRCAFCGRADDLHTHRDRLICSPCIAEIKAMGTPPSA